MLPYNSKRIDNITNYILLTKLYFLYIKHNIVYILLE